MAVILVDGNWLAARAAFALPESIRSRSGSPANAVYGFFKALAAELRSAPPAALAIAFDAPGPTFRHRICRSYKGNRAALPSSFGEQLNQIKSNLDALGTTRCEIELLEADDILASWARLSVEHSVDAYILSGDRDTAQLVENPRVQLLSRRKRGGLKVAATLDEEGIYNQFGVWPKEYVLYAALRGDQSDNLPGISGVGPKTAAALVRTYGSLDTLLNRLAELPSKLSEALKSRAEAVRLNTKLITLVKDADVPWPLQPFPGQEHWEARLQELFEEAGLPSKSSSK